MSDTNTKKPHISRMSRRAALLREQRLSKYSDVFREVATLNRRLAIQVDTKALGVNSRTAYNSIFVWSRRHGYKVRMVRLDEWTLSITRPDAPKA